MKKFIKNISKVIFSDRRFFNVSLLLVIPALLVISTIPLDASAQSDEQQPAFPGAEGFGKYTSGGRAGDVYEVTNLNNAGTGSLREAVEASGPRNVVFRVSGNINLTSQLRIDNDDISIFGQTAPGEGIAIKGHGVVIDADNVIIQYIRFRPGDVSGEELDALWGRERSNIIIDHCSMSWSTDETASFYDNENFTLQWSIISESLYSSVHSKDEHGYGGIWGGAGATFHHNLLAHHTSRNPRFNGARYTTTSETELADFRNNVIYNWGFNSAYGGEQGNYNMVANYYKPGPATDDEERIVAPSNPLGFWYVADNYVEGSSQVTADNWDGGVQGLSSSEMDYVRQENPFTVPELDSMDTAVEAYEKVLAYAGAILPKRDTLDARIVHETRTGTATFGGEYGAGTGIIDSQEDVGGWPELQSASPPEDTDADGIPDSWEMENGLNPEDPTDGKAINGSGYSNLESYIHSISGTESFEPVPGITELVYPVRETSVSVRPEFIWNVASGASSYQVQVSTGANEDDVVFDTTSTDTTFSWPEDIAALEGDKTYFWRVRGLNDDDQGGVWTSFDYFVTEMTTSTEAAGSLPEEFALNQNYPNPFNPSTTISYAVPVTSKIELRVYDMLGREIVVLVDQQKSAGIHRMNFNSESLSSGVYIYKLTGKPLNGSGEEVFIQTRKMTIIK